MALGTHALGSGPAVGLPACNARGGPSRLAEGSTCIRRGMRLSGPAAAAPFWPERPLHRALPWEPARRARWGVALPSPVLRPLLPVPGRPRGALRTAEAPPVVEPARRTDRDLVPPVARRSHPRMPLSEYGRASLSRPAGVPPGRRHIRPAAALDVGEPRGTCEGSSRGRQRTHGSLPAVGHSPTRTVCRRRDAFAGDAGAVLPAGGEGHVSAHDR